MKPFKWLIGLIPMLLFISLPVKAAEFDYQSKNAEVVEQRKDLAKQISKAKDKELIKLVKEDNKLAAYQAAYEKAMELSEQSIPDFTPTLASGDKVPPEYIPIYMAAGKKYNVDWEILAAVHKIETDYSRLPVMVSTAGAIGHMQFMPPTFRTYGVDGNGDGKADPWNLEDAIYSAANYLSASGYSKDVRKAIWHYNHAEWYVNKVVNTAAGIKVSYD